MVHELHFATELTKFFLMLAMTVSSVLMSYIYRSLVCLAVPRYHQ